MFVRSLNTSLEGLYNPGSVIKTKIKYLTISGLGATLLATVSAGRFNLGYSFPHIVSTLLQWSYLIYFDFLQMIFFVEGRRNWRMTFQKLPLQFCCEIVNSVKYLSKDNNFLNHRSSL